MSRPQLLAVVHDTIYTYTAPVDTAFHLACLSPQAGHQQQLLAHDLQIDPAPSAVSQAPDAFGNRRTHFSILTPHETLTVTAKSRVLVYPRRAQLDPRESPRWENVATMLRYRARAPFWPAADFAFASPFIPLVPALRQLAEASFRSGRPFAQAAIELMRRIHAEFKYESESTEVSTPLAEVLKQRRGVCQDFAHVMIGALRSVGLPAAYVSGYLLTRPPPGQPRLIGADASHAWVSIWCPVLGWIDLDPTNDQVVGTTHVTLAVGRDFGDVTPLRGVIRGGGSHSVTVSVTVTPEEEPQTERL